MRFSRSALWLLLLAGLLGRLGGVFFNGMSDVDQMVVVWGSAVRESGLGKAFAENYGPLSYLCYGLAAVLGEQLLRFWWLPYKVMVIGFDIAVFAVLWRLTARNARHWCVLMYWANPWFIIHGAWHGFWDAPHTLFAALAIYAFCRIRSAPWAWMSAGAILMISALFKPQGLFYFVVPVGIYLIIDLLTRKRWAVIRSSDKTSEGDLLLRQGRSAEGRVSRPIPDGSGEPSHFHAGVIAVGGFGGGRDPRRAVLSQLLTYTAGIVIVCLSMTAYLVCDGGSWLALPRNVSTVVRVMPNLCNECINVWRPIASGIMTVRGQTGDTTRCYLPPWLQLPIHAAAGIGTLSLIAYYCIWLLKHAAVEGKEGRFIEQTANLYCVLAFSSLVIPQLATKAHINHAYAGLVLLIPMAIRNRTILWAWLSMVAIHLYCHLADFGIGRASVRVSPEAASTEPASHLMMKINQQADSIASSEALLGFQRGVNSVLAGMDQELLVSSLSAAQFVAVVVIIWQCFSVVSRRDHLQVLGWDFQPVVR